MIAEQTKLLEVDQWSFDPGLGRYVRPSDNQQKENGLLKPLRPLQAQAIDSVKRSLLSGKKRVMLKAPTGSGKTVIASHIIQSALEKNKKVIFCVNAISLVDQTVNKFWSEGIKAIGVMQGNHEMTDSRKPIQVCSVQTLQRRLLPKADLVIIDEAHNWFKFYGEWMKLWPDVPFIGLSATPYTKGLGKYYDDLVIACTTHDLIRDRLLSPFRVFAPSHPDLKDVRIQAGDYHEGDLGKAMDKNILIADVVETWIKFGENRSTLCYGVNRAHARHLQDEFLKSGIPCGYQDAFTEIEERRIIAEQFKRGEIKVVCNVGTLTTGIDWDVRCISLVRPTRSEILYQQIIGRGLRTAEGKEDCLILDHSDTTLRLGFVTDIDEKYIELDDGKENSNSKKKKVVPLPKECASCHFMKPPRVAKCPACGFLGLKQNEIINDDGELIELVEDGKQKKKLNRDLPPAQKARFYGELKTYSDHKGYKPGWAANKFRERFGVWPNAFTNAPMAAISEDTQRWIRRTQIKWAKGKGKK